MYSRRGVTQIPLPVQRLSIFSILGPERAKKLSIGVHGFAENRENRQPLDRERDLEKQGEGKRNSQRNGAGSPRRASGRSAKESARCARRAERAIKNARQRLHLAKPKAERARESLLWRCLRRLPRYGLDRRACGRAHGERSERLKCRSAIVWILPSPARARRACPLPGQRLSIFSVFRKAMHANAQLFCSLGPQDRENRQPLSRERASAPGACG